MIPTHAITRVHEAIDFPALAADYVRLIKAGPEWVALCPFHKEKTPSCKIHAHYFKCFGCGFGGGPIAWVMRLERITFSAAVRLLADRAGITIDRTHPPTRVQLQYAREEAALCEWWWGQRREALISLAMTDDDLADTMARILDWERGLTVRERFALYREGVTSEDRTRYAQWKVEEQAWLKTWLSLARASAA
jgi:hypothetical protein